MLHAVIFDLDGTLLDTEPDFTEIVNGQLRLHGRAEITAAEVRRHVSAGAAAIVQQGFGLAGDDPRLPALLDDFLGSYQRQIERSAAALFADVDLLLATLVDHGIRWGVMTNKHSRFSAPLLARFETFAGAGAVICPDDVGAGKPDPRGILRVCELLGVEAGHCVYVGDHPRDIEAARNAGMPGIAVRWGYLPAEPAIGEWGAAAVADSPRALLDWCLQRRGPHA
jgi:2-phosphoglycolate phosphatase